MKRRRTIEVRFPAEGVVGAEVSGYGSRDLIQEVTGRAPLYSRRSRAWCCQTSTARNVVALAETRGYDVVIGEVE